MATERIIYSGGDAIPSVLYASRAIGDTGAYQVLQDSVGNLKVNVASGNTSLSSSSGTMTLTLGTLVPATANVKTKVYGFSLTTTSATEMVVAFLHGTTRLWEVILQSPDGSVSGANLAVSPPAYLFQTPTNTTLSLSCSTALAIHWSVAYFQE